MIAAIIAECIGTAFFFSCTLAYDEPISVVIGLLAAKYAFGKISGGHFNSTGSLLMFMKGAIDFKRFMLYVIAQCVGALFALIWWNTFVKV